MTRGDRSLAWRICVPAVFVLAGALFVTSANASDGTDLRAGRYSDLGSLVRQESEAVDALRAESNALAEEVGALSAQVGDAGADEAQQLAESLRGPAGMAPVTGPGLTVTLTDAPEELLDAAEDVDAGNLVVHQQDIQAVANAMWGGGAEAMTIQGQRVISTTGIKCVGNTVVLHGVPYSPPYVITAVGNPDSMLTSVNSSPYIAIYKQYAASEDHQLGFEVEPHTEVSLPGFEGSPDLDYARSPTSVTGDPNDNDV